MISRNRPIFSRRSLPRRSGGRLARAGPGGTLGYAMVGEEGFEPSAPVTRLLPDGSGHLCYQGLRRLSQRAVNCLNQPINVEYCAPMVPAPSRQHSAECLLSYRLELQSRLGRDGKYLVCDAQLRETATSPLLTVLNQVAIPLLLVSIVLMLAGVARAGWRALAWVAAGSALLLAAMLPTSPQVAAGVLGAGFVLVSIGYVAAWHAVRIRRSIPVRR